MARSVPTVASEVPGNFLTGALWNAGPKALGDWSTSQPIFIGYQSTVQSIPNNAWTSFTIDTEILDSDGGHSTTTNTSRYTATVPGVYLVFGTSGYVSNTTGLRRARIALNGSPVIGAGMGSDTHAASGAIGEFVGSLVPMNGTTDFVEVQGYQTSGGALNSNTNPATEFTPSLRCFWIRS
ncbi:hypothetical protein ACFYOF_17080 [Streptomyces sp. NPDC007148]|uniref:hypothetical protein n=1 Tax=Streptomyces sp. NPDC007148 TaxID=3364775 RepID=UPI0036B0F2B0